MNTLSHPEIRSLVDAQAGGELVHVNPGILDGMAQVIKTVTVGQGADLAWPALLRKLDRIDPTYRS